MVKIVHTLRFQLPAVVLGVFVGMLFLLMLFFHEMGAILIKTKQLAQSAEINDGVANWISILSTSARERTKLMSLGKESYLRTFQVTLDEINDLYGNLQTLGPDTLVPSVRSLRSLHDRHMEYAALLDGFAKGQAARRLAKAQAQALAAAAQEKQAAAAAAKPPGKKTKVKAKGARKAPGKLHRGIRGDAKAGRVAKVRPPAREEGLEEAKEIELDSASNEVFKTYEQNLREGLYLAQEQMRGERRDKLQSLRNSVGRAKDRLVYSLILLLATVAYVAVILKWKMLDPMQILKEGATQIGNGALGYQVIVNSRNEIGELAHVFNRMSVQLQQKQDAELRLRRLEAIEQIVRSVNHEINNPLMIISGNAEYLLAILERSAVGAVDPDILAKLNSIVDEVRRIFTTTQRLKEIKEPITQNYIGEADKMIDIVRSSQIRQRDY